MLHCIIVYRIRLQMITLRVVLFSLLSLVNLAFATTEKENHKLPISNIPENIIELESRILAIEKGINEIKSIINKEYPNSIYNDLNKTSITLIGNHSTQISSGKTDLFLSDVNDTPFNSNSQEVYTVDKAEYDLALATLKNKNFSLAEIQFANFIKNYPKSKLQGSAIFWYAETFYRRGIYNKAMIYYLQSYKKYPMGVKAPHSLLKLSYSMANLNKLNEACNILNKLELQFPDLSESLTKRSQDARNRFSCNQYNTS